MKLIIVESPTKSRTIQKFLPSGFKIIPTLGHIRDLPQKSLGVDIENDFRPSYRLIAGKSKVVKELKKEAKKAKTIYLSTDPDREGEAIAWHVLRILKLPEKKYQRIVFHEITKSALEEALKNPRKIDINLVNAQQARRILDRLVGYKLSPFLWRKIAKGLSAGRVQSVAVRLIVEREREIRNFIPQEYWTIVALLKKKDDGEFKATLVQKGNKKIPKMGIKTKKEADKILNDLKGAEYKLIKIEKKETKRNPLAPFTTSTLQQEAWKRFHFPAKTTMQLAQKLYETGLITYHRTDSTNLSQEALQMAKDWILKNLKKEYWAGEFKQYKTKSKVAQEAHEAIRPTNAFQTPEDLNLEDRHKKIYQLIWQRFIASQMSPAVFDSLAYDIKAKDYVFRATGQKLKFDGFSKIYPVSFEEKELPELEKNEILNLKKLSAEKHSTQPPARYTEASLVKELEKNGIGRPSTYAPIISLIQKRGYVRKNAEKRFYPTELGEIVVDVLVKHFPQIIDIGFTAKMENDLDEIANGKKSWVKTLKEFYFPFNELLKQKYKEVKKGDLFEKTEKRCPLCNSPLKIRISKYGKFYACSNYPKCKFTQPFNTLGISCPKCKKGEIVERKTKKGKIFYGCTLWPQCDFSLWDQPLKETCPKCKAILVKTKNGKIKCSSCDYEKIPPIETS